MVHHLAGGEGSISQITLAASARIEKGAILEDLVQSEEAPAAYENLEYRYSRSQTPALAEFAVSAAINRSLILTGIGRTGIYA